MAFTLRDIAKEANVSIATVSRALNTPDKVRSKTLKKILDVVQKEGYDVDINTAISGIPTNKIIACLTSEVDTPFINATLSSLSKIAAQHDYYVSIHVTLNELFEKKLYDMYTHSDCAGIVLVGNSYINNVDTNIPVCVIDDTNRINGNFYNVSSDNNAAIRLLLDHVVKLGHTKIGFISGNPNTASGNVRHKIFINQMNERGLQLPAEFIYKGDYLLQTGVAAFDYFYSLPDMPTAIISANDEMAKGFIVRAHSLGLRIPDEISICGIDAIPGDLFIPKITSVAQNTKMLAEETFNFINAGKKASEITKKTIPVVFSPGETTYKLM